MVVDLVPDVRKQSGVHAVTLQGRVLGVALYERDRKAGLQARSQELVHLRLRVADPGRSERMSATPGGWPEDSVDRLNEPSIGSEARRRTCIGTQETREPMTNAVRQLTLRARQTRKSSTVTSIDCRAARLS